MKKLSKDEKRIIKEDIADLKFLLQQAKANNKNDKAADIESEIESLKKKLKGGE